MPRKDVRFNSKYIKNTANNRKDDKVQGEEIGNGTITGKHIADGSITADKFAPGAVSVASLADGSVTTSKIADSNITTSKIAGNAVTGDKIAATTLVNPIAHGYHLSANRSAGWVRIAHLNNMGGVEFWTRASVSGNHSITKWTFTYTYFENSPCITVNMGCNSSYGTPWNNIRIVRKSTYDRVYLELNLAIALSFQVSQVSAFGSYISGISNITIENGSIPTGYTAVTFGNYVNNASAVLSV
jgi:hypothetical protein